MRSLANLFAPFGGAGRAGPCPCRTRDLSGKLGGAPSAPRGSGGRGTSRGCSGAASGQATLGAWHVLAGCGVVRLDAGGGAAHCGSRLYLTGVTLACPPRRRWDTRATVVASRTSDAPPGPVQELPPTWSLVSRIVWKESGAFFRLVKLTTNAPPGMAATGGTRHGQGYQEARSFA